MSQSSGCQAEQHQCKYCGLLCSTKEELKDHIYSTQACLIMHNTRRGSRRQRDVERRAFLSGRMQSGKTQEIVCFHRMVVNGSEIQKEKKKLPIDAEERKVIKERYSKRINALKGKRTSRKSSRK